MNHRIPTLLLAGALAFTAAPAWAGDLAQVVSADESVAPSGEAAVIDHGHVDMGALIVDGQAQFKARDDSQPTPVWRDPKDVVFAVDDKALQTLPETNDFAFTGAQPGSQVWVIPQTEVAGVPWLGWNTQAPSLTEVADRGVNIEFLGHSGPGDFSLFLQNGGFEAPQLLFSTAEHGEDSLWVDLHTHTHANWTFTEPGAHKVGLRLTTTTTSGEELSTDAVLNFAVGPDAATPQAADAARSLPFEPTTASAGFAGLPMWAWWTVGIVLALVVLGALGAALRGVRRG